MKETMTLKISSVNQITLPSFARKKLGIGAGDEVDVWVEGDELIITKAMTKKEKIEAASAKLDKIREREFKRMTPEQKARTEMSKGWTINQYHEHIDNLSETKAHIKEKYNVEVA